MASRLRSAQLCWSLLLLACTAQPLQARALGGDIGPRSEASVSIQVSISPRFAVTASDPSKELHVSSNTAALRYSYEVQTLLPGEAAAPAGGEASLTDRSRWKSLQPPRLGTAGLLVLIVPD